MSPRKKPLTIPPLAFDNAVKQALRAPRRKCFVLVTDAGDAQLYTNKRECIRDARAFTRRLANVHETVVYLVTSAESVTMIFQCHWDDSRKRVVADEL